MCPNLKVMISFLKKNHNYYQASDRTCIVKKLGKLKFPCHGHCAQIQNGENQIETKKREITS